MQKINKSEIQELGLDAIKGYFLVDPSTIDDPKVLLHLMQKAKLGMSFEKEMNVNKRSTDMMSFRIMKLTTSDKNELKEHIKRTMPQYL